jgi:drug/metabolite transporter (DMT)-like permease
LSKVALEWLPPGWLAFARFGLACAILVPIARAGFLAACRPAVLASGAVGYGGPVVLQNAGIARTSVSQAALLIGAVPVLVAVIAAVWQHAVARPLAWAGFAVSLAGVGLVTTGGGGRGSLSGDGLVLASLVLSATFMVAQPGLLAGRDPMTVTAVQFLGATLAVLPISLIFEGLPAAPAGAGTALATAGLAVGGTLLPFTLFAYGQSRVAAEIAGAFVNIEPVVGALAGTVVFGDPASLALVGGGLAILVGIAMSSRDVLAAGRTRAPGTRSPRHDRGRLSAAGSEIRPWSSVPADGADHNRQDSWHDPLAADQVDARCGHWLPAAESRADRVLIQAVRYPRRGQAHPQQQPAAWPQHAGGLARITGAR